MNLSSSYLLPLLLLLVALLLRPAAAAPEVYGTCQAMKTDPGCTQFGLNVGSVVFVPPDTTLDELEVTVVSYIGGINFITITEPCRSLLIRMICLGYLRTCVNDSTGAVALPWQLCRYQCQYYVTECQATYDLFVQQSGSGLYFPPNSTLPITCTEVDFYAQNQPLYPSSTLSYVHNNVSFSLPCNNCTGIPLLVPTECSSELSYDPESGGCAFTCPVPALSDDEYYNAKVMQGVIGWFSWVGTTILIVCYMVNPALRSFPRNMILMTAMAANIAAGAIILPTMVGYDNIWCGGETQYVKPNYYFPPQQVVNGTTQPNDYVIQFEDEDLLISSSPCTFQGAILQFGYLAATFWWGLIALNIFLEVYFNTLLKLETVWPKWIRIVFYQMVGWGVPFLFMVIPAAAGRIKFAPGATYCFVTNEDDQAYQLTFWFIPVGITLLFGFIFFVLALIKIVFVMISLRKLKQLWRYARLLIFIFLYLFLFCFIFSYNIQIEVNKDDITQGYSDYYKCLTRDKVACSLDDDVSNYDLIMLKGFAISVLGFLLFLVFMSWEVFKFWYLIFKSLGLLVMNRNRAQATVVFNLFAHERAQATSLQGTDTSLKSMTDTTKDEHEDELNEEEDDASEDDKSSDQVEASSSSSD